MARYNNVDEERDYYERNQPPRREPRWGYDEARRERPMSHYERQLYGRGRFGERADYEYDEPRYGEYRPPREEDYERRYYERDREYSRERFGGHEGFRSRVRCRDIMTRDLAVVTRETNLTEIARMMKEEDTGVIPVLEFETRKGESKPGSEERRFNGRGKLIGLITDRDIVIRAVAEGKDCGAIHAEEIMSTDIQTAKPHDRVVDVLEKMGNKQVRRIPIVGENGYLRGMISLSDIALETDADRELAGALEDISKQSSFWHRIFG